MTREEAIKLIRKHECCSEHYEACEMAIKALESLDKIRAEIEALEDKMLNLPNDWRTSEVFENVLDIIDKHIGGKE